MYNEQIEQLISAALADGVLTEKEKQILFKKAQSMGIDLDEFEMVLDARLVELAKAEKAKAEASAPKSNKLGDVKKCPACGAMVQSYQGVCPECGYAFEGNDVSSAAKELSNLLQKTQDENAMRKIIDTFPIPMQKAALIDFTSWLRPQALDVKNPLSGSYFKKYEECIHKVRISFGTDAELGNYVNLFEEDKKKYKRRNLLHTTKIVFSKRGTWIIMGIIMLLSFVAWRSLSATRNESLCESKIQKALNKNDIDKAYDLAISYRGIWELSDASIASIVKELLKKDDIDRATRLYSIAGGRNSRTEIFNYYVHKGDIETAWNEYSSRDSYGRDEQNLAAIITKLCADGDKVSARKFLNSHIDDLKETNPDYTSAAKTNRAQILKKYTNYIAQN